MAEQVEVCPEMPLEAIQKELVMQGRGRYMTVDHVNMAEVPEAEVSQVERAG